MITCPGYVSGGSLRGAGSSYGTGNGTSSGSCPVPSFTATIRLANINKLTIRKKINLLVALIINFCQTLFKYVMPQP